MSVDPAAGDNPGRPAANHLTVRAPIPGGSPFPSARRNANLPRMTPMTTAHPAPPADAPVAVGVEWLIDAAGCRPERLRDPQRLQALCRQILAELGLHALGEGLWHQFPGPGGVTGLILLSESHLACHTYPEHGVATFNLYCCRPRPPWPWAERLRAALGAAGVRVRCLDREARP
jgi:S-adenosylmethionine decarboxylase